MRRRLETSLWAFSLASYAFVLALIALGTLALALNRVPSPVLLAPALALAAVAAAWVLQGMGLSWVRVAIAAAVVALVVAGLTGVGLVLAARVYDLSFDGHWYHQRAVELLAGGWNPFREVAAPQVSSSRIQITHFPKGLWIAETVLYRLTGRIEAVKAINGLFLAASAAAACASFLRLPGLVRGAPWVLGLLAASGPIALVQLPTTMVDGALVGLWCSGAAAVVARGTGGPSRGATATLLATCALLPLVKFSGLPAVGFLLLPLALVPGVWREPRRRFVPAAGALVAAVSTLVLGFNPYVTNWIHYGHPLAPVPAEGFNTYLQWMEPANLRSLPPPLKVGASVFARSDGGREIEAAELKMPLTVRRSELRAFRRAVDVRLAGLGPLFSAALLVGLAGVAVRSAPRWGVGVVLLALSIAVSVLFTPGGWMARLAPQLWLVPVLAALRLLAARRRVWRFCGIFATALLVADLLLVAVPRYAGLRERNRGMAEHLARLADSERVVIHIPRWTADRLRLEEAGVRFVEVAARERLPCERPRILPGSDDSRYCVEPPGEPGAPP